MMFEASTMWYLILGQLSFVAHPQFYNNNPAMKMSRPSPSANYLFYSQMQQNQPQHKNVFSSGVSRPKLIAKKSQLISQNLAQFSLKDIKSKAKNLILDYLHGELKIQALPQELSSKVQAIWTAENINGIFELVFTIITGSFRLAASKSELKQPAPPANREKELTFAIRSKQAKLLRLIKEDQTPSERVSKGKHSKKIQQCQRLNEELKKELFTLKQEKQSLEKKIASLVQEFQNRKTFYLAQIKKLTQIIKMSSVDVRNLVLEKTKEAKKLQQKHPTNKNEPFSAERVQSELNIPENHNQRNQLSPKPHEKSYQNVGTYNGYNTQIRIMKHVSSIQNYQEEKADSYITF